MADSNIKDWKNTEGGIVMSRDTQFAYNLRLLMAGLSGKPTERRDLAKAINVTPDAVTKYMSAERRPAPETMDAIADYFGISSRRLARSSLLLGPGKGPAKMLDLYEGDLKVPVEENTPVGTFTFETGEFAYRMPALGGSAMGGGYLILRHGMKGVQGEFILVSRDGKTEILTKSDVLYVNIETREYARPPMEEELIGSVMYMIRNTTK